MHIGIKCTIATGRHIRKKIHHVSGHKQELRFYSG